jgi:D-alanine-D-alanine ligase-like ATP-grasp enzyme
MSKLRVAVIFGGNSPEHEVSIGLELVFRVGVDAMQERRLEDAEHAFGRVIAMVPAFAEGWNKRATVRYMRKNFTGSLADC